MMRAAVPLLLALPACSQGEPMRGETIACALDGASEMTRACMLEIDGDNGDFVVHRPDGGFRRFAKQPDGSFEPADGAEPLSFSSDSSAETADLAIGADRYRIPLKLLPAK